MMPELGKYAGTVLSAYGASLVLLGLLVWASLWRAARVKRQLREVEARSAAAKASKTAGQGTAQDA